MGFLSNLFGSPKPTPVVIIYNVLHEEIDRVQGAWDLSGVDVRGRNWSHADLSGLSFYGAQCDGINLSARGCTGLISKKRHFAAQNLRSVTRPVQILEARIFGSVLSMELKLLWADGTRLRILLMPGQRSHRHSRA